MAFGKRSLCAKSSDPDGRIVQSVPGTHGDSQYHGHMAPPTFGRKYLVCFYCNKKSGIKYDGLIAQWECARCGSMNFLDENGDIADPPVATEHTSSNDLKYSFSRADSPLSETFSQGSNSAYFCSTCLHNQHLFAASLQQYHVEIDPSHPEYKESDRKYFKYRKSLEKLYPQVCEDCWPKVRERVVETKKISRSDNLRRKLDKSRKMRLAIKRITLADTRDFMGKFLWYIGLFGQLLWHITALVAIAGHYRTTTPDSPLPAFIPALLFTLSEACSFLPTGSSLGRWGLIFSAASFWWNPQFRQWYNGFSIHIEGIGDWYKHQFILLVLRGLFYFVMRERDFTDTSTSPAGAAAHIFVLLFVTFLAGRSDRFIKVNMTVLWDFTPEKPPYIGPGSSPDQSGNSIRDALKEIGASPSRINGSTPTPSPPSYERYRPQPYQPGSIRIGHDRTASIQPLKALNVPSARGRTSPLFNNTCTPASESRPSLDQQYAGVNLSDMDWSPEPSQPASQHRAFTENLPVDNDAVFFGRATAQKNTNLFGQSPVVPQSAAFWYKVPPAPIAPAHQLRNPPNQPRMRVASREQKENFFNDISRRSPSTQDPPETATSVKYDSQPQEIEFAQQKFFAPDAPSKDHDDLVDALNGWSLGGSDSRHSPKKAVETSRVRHIGQGIALFIALVFWNQALNNPSEHTKNIILAVMIGCLCIGARTILDNTIYTIGENEKQNIERVKNVENVVACTIGTCLGGLECAAACYGLIEILAGTGECENCGPLGTVLVGGMMVHEIWLASFG